MPAPDDYLDSTGRSGHLSGGAPRGWYLHCPNGSHMAMYDDQETYFRGLVDFLLDVDATG